MTYDPAAKRVQKELAKTPMDRLKEARVKYLRFKPNGRTINTPILDQRHANLKALLGGACNAYDLVTDMFQLNALCYMHHTRLDGNDDFDPPNYDQDRFPKQARAQFHQVCQYRFPHQLSEEDRHEQQPKLVAYIHWNDFIQNVEFLELNSAPLREMCGDIEMMLLVRRRPALVPPNMIKDRDTPTLYSSFDINQAAKNDYRIFYIQKGRQNNQCVRYYILDRSNNINPVTSIWFVVTDLVQFYNNEYDNEASLEELEEKYNAFKKTYRDIYEQLRSNGTIRVVDDVDYMQSPAFDIQFLRLITSPFAKAISEKLFPTALLSTMATNQHQQQQQQEEDLRSNVYKPQQEQESMSTRVGGNVPARRQNQIREDNTDDEAMECDRETSPKGVLRKVTESFETVVSDFEKLLHNRTIVGYYTTQATFYELHALCEAVYTTLNDMQIKNKWRSSLADYRTGLQAKRILYERRGIRYVTAPHFLMYCLKLGSEYNIPQTWTDRVRVFITATSMEMLEQQYPVVDYDVEKETFHENELTLAEEPFTAETVARNVTNILWLKRKLAKVMFEKGFPRRIFGGKDDYYNLNELACVAGPYSHPKETKSVICTISGALLKSCMAGFVAQKETLLVTRDLFIDAVWAQLANASGYQKIADAFAKGAGRIASGVRNPSSMITSVMNENVRVIYSQGTEQEIQEYAEQVGQNEDAMADENLTAENPLRRVRTVVAPPTVTVPTVSEAIQLKTLELASAERIRQMELRSAETIALASVEATAREEEAKARQEEAIGKAREEEARARQKEADGKAREEEAKAEADARKTEADANARKTEALAKAREAKSKALEAQWDPVARAAEAAENKAKFELQKEQLIRGSNQAQPIVNEGTEEAPHHQRPAGPRSPKRKIPKVASTRHKPPMLPAVLPQTFAPPRYSETCTRPKRGRKVVEQKDENIVSAIQPVVDAQQREANDTSNKENDVPVK